jgi:hypothetical protein
MDMITRANYEEKITQFDVENLEPTLLSTHKWYVETSEFYDVDKDIKDTIDLYFRKLEKYIQQFNAAIATQDAKPKIKSTPQTPKAQHKVITEIKNTREKRAIPKEKATQKKQTTPEFNDQIQWAEVLPEEIKIIRRYVGLHEKTKNNVFILNLIKALQKAVVEKKINKNSNHAEDIRNIQHNLLKVYNSMDKQMLITINEKDLLRLVAIAGGEKVYPSITFLKRYIGFQGKAIEDEKITLFITQAEKAINTGKIRNDDPYVTKVEALVKNLKTFLKSNEQYVSISEATLNGLEGIVNACGCHQVGEIYHTGGKILRPCKTKTYSDAKRGACSHHHGLSGLMSASDVSNQEFVLLPFTGVWEALVGKPEKNFTMMLHGEPNAGKSTFLMKFAQYLTKIGSVLYVSPEEHGSVTLRDKVNTYLNPLPSNIAFAPDFESITLGGSTVSDFDCVIIDSVTDLKLSLDEFKTLKRENPQTAFVLVLQHNKDGSFRGGKEWEHEVQIVGEVSNGTITIYKNRYGTKGAMNFFD